MSEAEITLSEAEMSMHRILLLYATEAESAGLRALYDWQPDEDGLLWIVGKGSYMLAHSGIGMVNTAFTLGKLTQKFRFDLIVNLGIAGAIDPSLELGEVVEVTQDCFAEMGAERADDGFLNLEEMGFSQVKEKPLYNQIYNPFQSKASIKKVQAVTVNKVHGSESGIACMKTLWPQAQIESMEGAAVFLAAHRAGIPCLQFRAISNNVEPRNKDAWDIPFALKNLSLFIENIIEQKPEALALNLSKGET